MTTDSYKIGLGLRRIRRRRSLLWGVMLVYLPEMWITLQITKSRTPLLVVYCVWFVLLWNSAVLVAFARCPRCGNYFHTKGLRFLPFYARSCRHCGLGVNEDKTQ